MKLSIAHSALILTLAGGLVACSETEPAAEPAPAPGEVAPKAEPQAQPEAQPQARPETQPEAAPKTEAEKREGPKVTIERAEPEVDRDAELTVKRLVIAHGVKDREPVDGGAVFSTTADRIYAFVEVGNAERAPSEIFVSFIKEGQAERGRIPLRVGASPRWRTWAYTRLADEPGAYAAIVRDARGREIARETFEVVSEEEPTAQVEKVGEPHI